MKFYMWAPLIFLTLFFSFYPGENNFKKIKTSLIFPYLWLKKLSVYKFVIKPLLFLLSPEKAHHLTFWLLKWTLKIPGMKALFQHFFVYNDPRLEREVFGLKFKNPVGLAAGLDKDAKLVNELACVGFGFIEIGTVTPLPQPGNPTPRLFRLPKDQGLINRMGFNNEGAEAAALRLKKSNPNIIIGGNIGKNKATPNAYADLDYEKAFHVLYDVVDYFVINVSSPNTPNLRELQEKEPLKKLLLNIKRLNQEKPLPKPILLKIAPDLNNQQLDDVVAIVLETEINGVIATNTTINRHGLSTSESEIATIGAGGLSGKPLRNRSTAVIRYIHQQAKGTFPIIGVGGIHSPTDALEKLAAGASLVQLYTGFIYEGPGIIKRINKAILKQ